MPSLLILCIFYGILRTGASEWQTFKCPSGCRCKEFNQNSTGAEETGVMAICELSVNGESVRQLFNTLPKSTTSLTLRSSNLVDLTDLCCMYNVKELDLSYNSIADTASYYQYPAVRVLRLQHNQFHVLRKDEFISFFNVVSLWLDENRIEHIDQEALRLVSLKNLSLRSNRIAYISETLFRFLPSLERLDLSGNLLYKLGPRNFFYCDNLKSLDVSNNGIIEVDNKAFVPLRLLSELNLADNKLTHVPTLALYAFQWKKLILDGNPLTCFPVSSFANISVESLSLNRINNLVVIPQQAFTGIMGLKRLSISQCPSLQYLSLLWMDSCCDKLEKIILIRNNISFIPELSKVISKKRDIDLNGNPLRCNCLSNRDMEALKSASPDFTCTESHLSSSAKDLCYKYVFLPIDQSEVNGKIGDTILLYCIVSINGSIINPTWYLPNGSRISAVQKTGRFLATAEMLSINQLLPSDSGVYTCTVGNEKMHRRIEINVETPKIIIYPVEVTWQSITIGWNGSRDAWKQGEFMLRFNSTQSDLFYSTVLPSYNTIYTVSRLQPSMNYTLCIAYVRAQIEYYTYCIEVETDSYRLGIQTKFSYGFLYLILTTLLLICTFCLIRFLQKRIFIWEEEKGRAKVQQSLSGESFLQATTSPTTSVGITYENPVAFAYTTPFSDQPSTSSGGSEAVKPSEGSTSINMQVLTSSLNKGSTDNSASKKSTFNTWIPNELSL